MTTDPQDELFALVDADDRLIGSATRAACHADKSKIHRSVSILIFNAAGEILLQRRSLTKDTYPGWWTLSATGHVDYGETYEAAAAREIAEELGIEASPRFLGKHLMRFPHETEFVGIFDTRHEGPFRFHPQEIIEGCFVPLAEAVRPAADRQLTPLARGVLDIYLNENRPGGAPERVSRAIAG
jgi:isopentenyl-diphosphate delta-isomerase type 1